MTQILIKPEAQNLFGRAESLDAAFQEMKEELEVPENKLFPLVMKYHNTLLAQAGSQVPINCR